MLAGQSRFPYHSKLILNAIFLNSTVPKSPNPFAWCNGTFPISSAFKEICIYFHSSSETALPCLDSRFIQEESDIKWDANPKQGINLAGPFHHHVLEERGKLKNPKEAH